MSGFDETLDGHLRRWPPSSDLVFEPCGEIQRPHYVHGAFMVPLFLQDDANNLTLDLNALKPALGELLQYLDQA